MKRYLLAIVAVAFLAASCSGSSDAAATVNGTDIEAADVEGMVYPSDEELGDEEFVQLLDITVQWTAIADAANSDFGIDPTEEEVDAEVDRIYTAEAEASAAQGLGELTFDAFLEAQNISESGLDQYASQLLIGEGVLTELTADLDEPTAAEAEQLLIDDPYSWTTVCAAHILVATPEEADSVMADLEAGEDFAAIASEVSVDPGSGAAGGDLGCTTAATYVEPFADATMTAEIGEVVGPVESEFGFHVIRVDSRTLATAEELQAGLRDTMIAEAVDEWYVTSITAAEVTVDEQYGTWETEPFPGIVPVAS